MKNFTCLSFSLLFLFHAFTGKSQSEYYNQNWAFDVYLIGLHPIELKTNGEFSEVKFISTSKKKKQTYIKRYNEKGLLTEYYWGNNSDSIAKRAIFTYNQNYQLQQVNRYEKHKLHHQYIYKFNDKNNITLLQKYNGKNEIIRNRTWNYNSLGFIETATTSKRKSMDTLEYWKYEYYDAGKIAKTSRFKKGKFKGEWDYMCKTEGEKVTRRNFHKVCKWEETSKDTLTAIFQSTNDKGKTTKTIYKYTIKDTLILSYAQYDHKNEIIRKLTYDKSFDKILTWCIYQKGKLSYENTNTYKDGKLISSIGRYPQKNKILFRDEYLYDESNNLTQYRRFNKKDELKSEMNITYTKR